MTTLSDVVINLFITVFLILPGFLSLNIIYWALGRRHKLSTFELTSMSMLVSMFIVGLVIVTTTYIFGQSIDVLTGDAITPALIGSYVILSLFWAGAIGYWASIILVKEEDILLHQLLPFVEKKGKYSFFESTWKECFEHYDGMVSIITHDGKEYTGNLGSTSPEDFPREILILTPKEIIRDDERKITLKKAMGEQMLFVESDIQRVACWKNQKGKKEK